MNTIEKLDALAEIDAQKTLLSIQKQELLDAVKIPAEVQAIHDKSVKQKGELDLRYSETANAIDYETGELLSAVVIPPEILEVYRQIEEARRKIEEKANREKAEAWNLMSREKARIDDEFNNSVAGVYTEVAKRKWEIDIEFSEKIDAADANAEKLKEEIKNEVKAAGKTITGKYKQAVYAKGRITWNTDKMEAWIVDHPFLKDARKEGDPSVSFRNVG